MRVLAEERAGGEELLARPVKPWTWPPVIAVDAGPMQIQLWVETVLRCATVALWSMTGHTADRENGYGETVL
jgi:hypothetical protein